jgi:hypothetical protein
MSNNSGNYNVRGPEPLNPLQNHWFQCELYSGAALQDNEYNQDFSTIKKNLINYVQSTLVAEKKTGYIVAMHVTLANSANVGAAYRLTADPTIIPEKLRKPLDAVNDLNPIGLAATNSTHNPPPPPPPPPPSDVLINCAFLKLDEYKGKSAIISQEILKDNEFAVLKARLERTGISELEK